MDEIKEIRNTWIAVSVFVLILVGIIIALMVGIPQYNVWRKELNGKTNLREAQWSKQIQIEEAIANLEAEKLNAQAEIERAKGAAKAIEIENGSLSERYIQYLWVRQQQRLNEKTVIYIPTETNLPILEANRLK